MTKCTECKEAEAVCMLTLTGMDSVVVDDAKLCQDCASAIVTFRTEDSKWGNKGAPQAIIL